MAIFNFDAAKLSVAQTWAVIVIAGGVLGISIFRENKAVTNIQDTRDKVIEHGVDLNYIKEEVNEIKQRQNSLVEETEEHNEFADNVYGEVKKLQKNQQEIVNMGRYYIENQDSISSDQMKDAIDEWVKKKGWIPIVLGEWSLLSNTKTENPTYNSYP